MIVEQHNYCALKIGVKSVVQKGFTALVSLLFCSFPLSFQALVDFLRIRMALELFDQDKSIYCSYFNTMPRVSLIYSLTLETFSC